MSLFGTVSDIAKEISKTTPFSFDGISKVFKYNADDVAKSYASRKGVALGREIKSMKSQLDGIADTTSEQYKNLADSIAKKTSQFNDIASAHRTGTADAINNAFSGITGKDTIGIKATAQGYFMDGRYGSTRRKALVGGVAGVAVAKRYTSGGSLTRTSDGERDIVGIPFI